MTGRANTYRLLFPYPRYVQGHEMDIDIVYDDLPEEKVDELLARGTGKIYYYEEGEVYSYRKRLPLLVDLETGEIGLGVS